MTALHVTNIRAAMRGDADGIWYEGTADLRLADDDWITHAGTFWCGCRHADYQAAVKCARKAAAARLAGTAQAALF